MVDIRREYSAYVSAGSAGTVHSENARRCEREHNLVGNKGTHVRRRKERVGMQQLGRRSCQVTESDCVVLHTQARVLRFRVERLPVSMSIPSMVHQRLAYPCPVRIDAHSIGLDPVEQRRNFADFLADEPFVLRSLALGRWPSVKMSQKSMPIGSEGARPEEET